VRLESSGGWLRMARRGESDRGRGEPGDLGKMGEGAPGMLFIGPGGGNRDRERREPTGDVGRRRGEVGGGSALILRGGVGEIGEEEVGIESTRSRGGVERGKRGVVGRNRRPWRLQPPGWREVGDDRWGPPVPPVGEGEGRPAGGGDVDLRRKGGRAGREREGRGGRPGPGRRRERTWAEPEREEGEIICFSFYIIG
jgi:hypothetical protein